MPILQGHSCDTIPPSSFLTPNRPWRTCVSPWHHLTHAPTLYLCLSSRSQITMVIIKTKLLVVDGKTVLTLRFSQPGCLPCRGRPGAWSAALPDREVDKPGYASEVKTGPLLRDEEVIYLWHMGGQDFPLALSTVSVTYCSDRHANGRLRHMFPCFNASSVCFDAEGLAGMV